MTLLDDNKVEEAITTFKRGLEEVQSPRQQAYFRSAIIVAHLKQQRYNEAILQLAELPDSQPEAHVLQLHAVSGMGDEQKARKSHSQMLNRHKILPPSTNQSRLRFSTLRRPMASLL